jgi:Ca2+-binding RTX toxin-like protein
VRTPGALALPIALVVACGAAGPAQAATISINDAGAGEGKPVVFTISLDAPASEQVQVTYATTKGTAGASDFTAATGTVTIPPGFASNTISVTTKADKLIEPAETFTIDLSAPQGATIADSQGVGTIDNVAATGHCANILKGTKKANTLTGTERSDLITGLDGNDVINALAGNDCVDGGPDKDTIDGGDGADVLDGRGGKDTLIGGNGDDELSGGGDADTLDGGAGADKINGGSGKNKVQGGAGNDNIATQNGKKDTVDCGPGTKDQVRADPTDTVKNCEIRVAPK